MNAPVLVTTHPGAGAPWTLGVGGRMMGVVPAVTSRTPTKESDMTIRHVDSVINELRSRRAGHVDPELAVVRWAWDELPCILEEIEVAEAIIRDLVRQMRMVDVQPNTIFWSDAACALLDRAKTGTAEDEVASR